MTDAIDLAREYGRDAGLSAASWTFDGNTDVSTYRAFLQGLEDGDPETMDAYGPATGWLSGEYAAGPTPTELAHTLGLESDTEGDWSVIDAACDAYETAADEAYWSELERVARLHIG